MSIIRSLDETKLRSLKFSELGVRDPLVLKSIDTKLEDGIGLKQQISKRADDLSRISKLLVTKPGIKFVSNYGLLALAENKPKIDPARPFRSILQAGVGSIKTVASVLTAILSQVPVSGTGVHFSADIIANTTYLRPNSTRPRFPDGNFVRGQSTGNPTLVKSSQYGFRTDELLQFDDLNPNEEKYDVDTRLSKNKTTLGYTVQELEQLPQKSPYDKDFDIDVRLDRGKTKGKTTAGVAAGQDIINFLSVQTSEEENGETSDLIPFRFAIKTVRGDFYLYFRAYLESLDDNFTGEWNSTRYIGRAEQVYNYTGFSRDIGFTFKVAATSRSELLPLYQKLNYLAGSTAPVYNNSFMTSNYVILTIGDYLTAVPGIITKVSFTWNTTYPWELNLGTAGDIAEDGTYNLTPGDDKKLPHVLDVSVGFTPIHSFSPTLESDFISNIGVKEFSSNYSEIPTRPIRPETIPTVNTPSIKSIPSTTVIEPSIPSTIPGPGSKNVPKLQNNIPKKLPTTPVNFPSTGNVKNLKSTKVPTQSDLQVKLKPRKI